MHRVYFSTPRIQSKVYRVLVVQSWQYPPKRVSYGRMGSSLSKSRYILRSVFNGLQSSGVLANLNYFFVVNEVRIGLLIVRLRNNQTAGSEPNTETSTGIALLAYGPESRCQAVEEEKISNTIAILQSTAGAEQANNQTNNV
ncbi:hypothetical protein BofuT4_P089760.1 [Botrytis cinerea T4]|uniref:Uncharacterized protein n=1 Tax=Botryotinia fuckeliana (strain T4) TaxID=999810 RepID=G2YF82_BOTF4|nr:hypothetical protein BofuT4_P089760.1 [Botrytis cinerea T4]